MHSNPTPSLTVKLRPGAAAICNRKMCFVQINSKWLSRGAILHWRMHKLINHITLLLRIHNKGAIWIRMESREPTSWMTAAGHKCTAACCANAVRFQRMIAWWNGQNSKKKNVSVISIVRYLWTWSVVWPEIRACTATSRMRDWASAFIYWWFYAITNERNTICR